MNKTDRQWQFSRQRKRVSVMHDETVFEPKPPVHIARAKVYVPEAPGLPERKCNHLREALVYILGVGSLYVLLSWLTHLTNGFDFSIGRVLLFVLGYAIAKGLGTYFDHRSECR